MNKKWIAIFTAVIVGVAFTGCTPAPKAAVPAAEEFATAQDFYTGFYDNDSEFNEEIPLATVGKVIIASTKGVKGDGVTDDTLAIQKMVDAALDGDTVLFDGGTYKVSGIKINREINVLGENGAKFVLTTDGGVALQWVPHWIGDGFAIAKEVKVGATTVYMNKTTGIKVGDVVMFKTNRNAFSDSSIYKSGSVKYVKAINTTAKTITLNEPMEYGFNSTELSQLIVYKGYNNITVRGFGIQLKQDGKQYGLIANGLTGSKISDIVITGGGLNEVGIELIRGIDCVISNITANGFMDRSLGLGYGVHVAGHNIVVQNSNFSDCKHAVVGSENSFYVSHLTFRSNTANNCIAAFDFHDNVMYSSVEGNTINGLGSIYDNAGFWIRGPHNRVIKNTINAVENYQNCSGIKIITHASPDITVQDNIINGSNYGITFDELVVPASGYTITGNQITAKHPIIMGVETVSTLNLSVNTLTVTK